MNDFLKEVSGVVHVGAHIGQEAGLYNSHNLSVLWVEPIPWIFATLRNNVKNFPKHIAFQHFVSDTDDDDLILHVSSNDGMSSSIFSLGEHKDVWPHVSFLYNIPVRSITLPTLFRRHEINPRRYDALVLDTQASELLVLKGCIPIIDNFEYIKVEVSEFEAYINGCDLNDISEFMVSHGYFEVDRQVFATTKGGKGYFDIVYKRHRPVI